MPLVAELAGGVRTRYRTTGRKTQKIVCTWYAKSLNLESGGTQRHHDDMTIMYCCVKTFMTSCCGEVSQRRLCSIAGWWDEAYKTGTMQYDEIAIDKRYIQYCWSFYAPRAFQQFLAQWIAEQHCAVQPNSLAHWLKSEIRPSEWFATNQLHADDWK